MNNVQNNDSFAGGTYPIPDEPKVKTIKGTIVVEYEFEMEVPEDWDKEQIESDICQYLDEYKQNEKIIEIDI